MRPRKSASRVDGGQLSRQVLLMTKYNNYAGISTGDGHNRIAILDPNVTENDPVIPTTKVMREVITKLGVTPRPIVSKLSRRGSGMVH